MASSYKGQGKTGTQQGMIRLVSKSKRAVAARQKMLKDSFSVLSPAKADSIFKQRNFSVQKKAYLSKTLKKYQRVNNLGRSFGATQEVWHTLVKNGTHPIRNQVMSREKARNFNSFNTQNQNGLYWVMGKQEIPKSI